MSLVPVSSQHFLAVSAEALLLELHPSSPLPDEGVTLLARYGQGFLDARFEPTENALVVMVGCCSAFGGAVPVALSVTHVALGMPALSTH